MPQRIGETFRRRLTPQPPSPFGLGPQGPHSVVGSPRRSARLCLRRTAYDWGPWGSQRCPLPFFNGLLEGSRAGPDPVPRLHEAVSGGVGLQVHQVALHPEASEE
jgi:hypothetical protein